MIDVVVINQVPFIWNAEDVDHVRRQHRIIGALTGCLPRAPRQNGHLGLPLKLMPEEATLLHEKGLGRLVEYGRLDGEPATDDVETFEKLREEMYVQQNLLFKEERKQKIIAMADIIAAGKQKKRSRLKQTGSPAASAVPASVNVIDLTADNEVPQNVNDEDEIVEIKRVDSTEHNEIQVVDKEEIVREELSKLDDLQIPRDSVSVQLLNECPWLSKPEAKLASWHFPETAIERLRYEVFKNLWEKGYYLTAGGKFGGDFLVYPGDPLRYHALYIAICMPYHQKFLGFDVICKGRLGANVKKAVLMCYLNDDNEIKYISLQWTGIS